MVLVRNIHGDHSHKPLLVLVATEHPDHLLSNTRGPEDNLQHADVPAPHVVEEQQAGGARPGDAGQQQPKGSEQGHSEHMTIAIGNASQCLRSKVS